VYVYIIAQAPVLKKPAKFTPLLKRPAAAAKAVVAIPGNDDPAAATEIRDKVKARKFNDLFEKGCLPDTVAKAYEEAS
jgi:hypothetical protein